MRIYIGIYRAAIGLILAAAFLICIGMAVPLPTNPPEVDNTPVSHVEEPEDFRAPQDLPPSPEVVSSQVPIIPVEVPKQLPTQRVEPVLDTGTVLLIGVAIWYVTFVIGLVGGRRGKRHRE
ncbi:MAG: hypothetical protein RSF82_08055 [Angelakisella sp.]